MRRTLSVPLILLAATATLYAFWVADGLVREFAAGLTWVDVGVLFVMGLIAGVAVGALVRLNRSGPTRDR